jgi:hypothetical protein
VTLVLTPGTIGIQNYDDAAMYAVMALKQNHFHKEVSTLFHRQFIISDCVIYLLLRCAPHCASGAPHMPSASSKKSTRCS